MRAGTATRVQRMVAVVALASPGPVTAHAALVRLNAIAAHTSHAAFAVNRPDGRWASAEFFRSAWTVRVAAVGLVGGHDIEIAGGEGGVEPPGVEHRRLSAVTLRVQVADAPHHQPARRSCRS